MRRIFKKIKQGQYINDEEYRQLMNYIEQLGNDSFASYTVFHQQYAGILYTAYAIYLPPFPVGLDELYEYLTKNHEAIEKLFDLPASMASFPPALYPFLNHCLNYDYALLQQLHKSLHACLQKPLSLPRSRSGAAVFKYEEANPYKEIGLKNHFERLARYTFVSRLQTYRYLTRNKAVEDRIEVISDDQLGGIFTNKQKSIYYYIFLTEPDIEKANQACFLLNLVFYGK
ncbi:MAG: hypothetical protein PHD40_00685 [Syntrophomonadaceae bacterium]|nr:hypothetical protein [Syntrophomonadaceae bacterium]